MGRTIGLRQIVVTVTTAGTPVQISGSELITPEFEVFVPSANAGANMYVGDSTVDNTWVPRPTTSTVTFSHSTGDLSNDVGFDLSKIYIDADSNGDQAIVQYLAFDN